MKKALKFSIVFFVITQLGLISYESVKMYVAKNLGYKNNYFHPIYGRLTYSNVTIQNEFQKIEDRYGKDNRETYIKDPEWIQLVKMDTRNYALIELSGKLFLWIMSIMGLLLWKIGKNNNLKKLMWGGIFLSLLFLRDLPMYIFNILTKSMRCNEAKLWHYFNIPWSSAIYVVLTIGIIFFLFIFFNVIPKKDRKHFFVGGSLGGILGVFVWFKFTGCYLV